MTPDISDYEAVIVGGSFAGLSAAMQLGRARRRILVIDAGRPRNRFAHASHGFFGQDGRPPLEMIANAREQVMAYPTVEFYQGEATKAVQPNDLFTVTLGADREVRAKRLILATGVKDHLPDIPGMKELWGTGVAHCPYCHGYEVANRPIAVLTIGQISLHQAILLRDWSDNVTLLTNETLGLTPEDREQLKARGIKIEEVGVSRLIAATDALEVVGDELEAIQFNDGRILPFGALFIPVRYSFSSPLAEQLGCEVEAGMNGPLVKTDTFKESTVPGIFVAGDAARAMHNATFASADGVLAGTALHRSLVFPSS